MKALRIVLIIMFVLVLIFSCWKLTGILGEYREGQSSYDKLEQYVSFETPDSAKQESNRTNTAETGMNNPETPEEEPDNTVWPVVDFKELSRMNPDVVGWIFIEGTQINYPVVQAKDNNYYLRHLFDGRYNPSGAIFLDAANSRDFSDPHSIIYGHHMNDKSMFYTLDGYKEQEFYDQYNLALLVTPTHKYKIRLFSAYIASVDGNSWQLDFEDQSFSDWLEEIDEASDIKSEYAPGEGDRILTLSTCAYDFYLAKLVVHGYVERVFENTDTVTN